ncbi:MAG TPA: hypothetical protein VHR72_10920 [Gemmataceae bacterium]|jgi:hypothetical protein|nr:hypothetical protein [Gemmataceae bacterium]
MEWLADHASPIYFLLGFLTVLSGMAGVMGRRKILWLAVAVLLAALIPAAWLLFRGVSTETTRLEADIEALRKAIVAHDKEAAFKHVADDFKYKAKKRDKWFETLEQKMKEYGIDDLRVERLEVKSVSRGDSEASVSFHVNGLRGGQSIYSAECPGWKFTIVDGVWAVEHIAIRGAKLKGTPVSADE